MKYAVIESIGAMTLMAAATLPLSCVPAPTPVRGDLQPLIATAGTYALMDQKPVAPAVCETCGGRKVVGDGRIEIPCPDCQPAKAAPACSCPCGGKGYVTKDGRNWACECKPNCPCKCKDGRCSIAR